MLRALLIGTVALASLAAGAKADCATCQTRYYSYGSADYRPAPDVGVDDRLPRFKYYYGHEADRGAGQHYAGRYPLPSYPHYYYYQPMVAYRRPLCRVPYSDYCHRQPLARYYRNRW